MLDGLFETCGYIASFLGTLIEGEILLLTSVISAKLGYFNFFGGLLAAFLGAFVKDTIKFLIVKKQGKKLLQRKPRLQERINNASGWYNIRPLFYLSFYRVMYGFGTVIIILSGLKEEISYTKFALHSALGIGLWIAILGGLGYFCAEVLISNLNFLSTHSLQVIAVLVVIGLAYYFFIKRPREKYCFIPKES